MSGQSDLVVGTAVANRRRSDIESLIGFFVNTLALRVRLDGDPTVAELLARVKASTLGAYDHQDLPFEQVVDALQPERSMSYSPVIQVMLNMNSTPGSAELSLPGLTIRPVEQATTTTQFDLNLSLTDTGAQIEGSLSYASDLFDAATAERLTAHFLTLLGAMVADEQQPVSRLPLLDTAQRGELAAFSGGVGQFGSDQLIHQLFEARAASHPDAVAVVFEDRQLSYGELNRSANRLAHRLLQLGVRPDDRVALCLERGIDMVVALLATLKAGGAYVPLDPAYPAERLAHAFGDSAPVAILTQAALAAGLPPSAAPLLLLDGADDAALIAAQADGNPDPAALGLGATHLAYVIYTSGSTGRPKGVMVDTRQRDAPVRRHRRMVRLRRRRRVDPVPLLSRSTSRCGRSGARCCTAAAWWSFRTATSRSPQRFLRAAGREQGVTVLNQTPARSAS